MNSLRPLERAAIIVSDFLLAIAAFLCTLSVSSRFGFTDPLQSVHALQLDRSILLAGVLLIWFQFFGLYRDWFLVSRSQHLMVLGKACLAGATLLLIALCGTDALQSIMAGRFTLGLNSSRLVATSSFCLFTFSFLAAGRMFIQGITRGLVMKHIGLENTLIIGANPRGHRVARELLHKPVLGMRPIGFIADGHERAAVPKSETLPVLGDLEHAPELIRHHRVHHVVISQNTQSHNEILHILAQLEEVNVRIFLIPDLYDVVSGHLRTGTVWATNLLELYPDHMPTWKAGIKRLLDIVGSITILVCISPVLLLAMLCIKLTSPGPVFYTQERIGQYGKRFWIWKLRTMRIDAEKTGPQWAKKKDPRITPIGHLLRKTRLDEVPQLLCVLRGDMSLVGPRPEREVFINKLRSQIPLYVRRLKMKPGLTGWAQVTLGYDNSIDDVRRKVAADLWYFEHMSIALDIQIMLRTVLVVLTGKGAN